MLIRSRQCLLCEAAGIVCCATKQATSIVSHSRYCPLCDTADNVLLCDTAENVCRVKQQTMPAV